jgi:dolichol-phosphate mannosyltransferase
LASIAVPFDGATDVGPNSPLAGAFEPAAPVVFVVPAFNEAENVPRLLSDLEARPSLFPKSSRLIIVDDGSNDGTAEIIRSYEGPLPVELCELGTNQGPGAAFRRGFELALQEVAGDAHIVTLEADTTSDLDALPAMLEKAEQGADLVLASVHGGGRMLNVSVSRRILSSCASRITRLMLGLDAHTVSSFFRVYRASSLRAAFERYGDDLIRERGFACKAELLAKFVQLGAVVEEVPVDLDADRRVGASKMRVVPTLAGYWRLMSRQTEPVEESAPA